MAEYIPGTQKAPVLWSYASGTQVPEGAVVRVSLPVNRSGFLATPMHHTHAPLGWKAPFTDEEGTPINNGLGTVNTDASNLNVRVRAMARAEDLLIYRGEGPAKESPFGCIDWKGEGNDYLLFKGPNSRYMSDSTNVHPRAWFPSEEGAVFSLRTRYIPETNQTLMSFYGVAVRCVKWTDADGQLYRDTQGDVIYFPEGDYVLNEGAVTPACVPVDASAWERVYGRGIWYKGSLVAKTPLHSFSGTYSPISPSGGKVGHPEELKGAGIRSMQPDPEYYTAMGRIADWQEKTRTGGTDKWIVAVTTEWWGDNAETQYPVYTKVNVYVKPLDSAITDGKNYFSGAIPGIPSDVADAGVYQGLISQIKNSGSADEIAALRIQLADEYSKWHRIGDFDYNTGPAYIGTGPDYFGEVEPTEPAFFSQDGSKAIMNVRYFHDVPYDQRYKVNPDLLSAKAVEYYASRVQYSETTKRMLIEVPSDAWWSGASLNKSWDLDDFIYSTYSCGLGSAGTAGATRSVSSSKGTGFIAADFKGNEYVKATTLYTSRVEVEVSKSGSICEATNVQARVVKEQFSETLILPWTSYQGRSRTLTTTEVYYQFGTDYSVGPAEGSYLATLRNFAISALDLRYDAVVTLENQGDAVGTGTSTQVGNSRSWNFAVNVNDHINLNVSVPGVVEDTMQTWSGSSVQQAYFMSPDFSCPFLGCTDYLLVCQVFSYRERQSRRLGMYSNRCSLRIDWTKAVMLEVEKDFGVMKTLDDPSVFYVNANELDPKKNPAQNLVGSRYFQHYFSKAPEDAYPKYDTAAALGFTYWPTEEVCLLGINLA